LPGPLVFLGVKLGVACDDPAEIAGPRLAQDNLWPWGRVWRQQPFDAPHRRDQLILVDSL
jgi:hypothetical protein